jgi:hypothetical protein
MPESKLMSILLGPRLKDDFHRIPPWSSRMQKTVPEQIKRGSCICLSLDQLETGQRSFRLALAPVSIQR